MKYLRALIFFNVTLLGSLFTWSPAEEPDLPSTATQAAVPMPIIQSTPSPAFELRHPEFEYDYNLPAANIDTTTPVNFTVGSDSNQGIFAFRGNAQRNAPARGKLKSRPLKFKHIWSFQTAYNSKPTEFGVWGGGTGWTGQPLYVHWQTQPGWNQNLLPEFSQSSDLHELLVGTLSGHIYFIDLLTGRATRQALAIDNPIKSTLALHPEQNGLLLVGQGVQQTKKFGNYVFDMFQGKLLHHQSGHDAFAYRGWGAFDSNPLIDPKSEYLFWPAENGLIYRSKISPQGKIDAPLKFRYKVQNKAYQGLEASFAAYQNQGYFADNSGNVFALNLETMKPLWHFDNLDDSDASIALDLEADTPYLYLGNEVDKQGKTGQAYFRKINGKTGEEVWSVSRVCESVHDSNGGILSTALIGKHKAQNLVITVFSRVGKSGGGEVVAVDKGTGELLYSIPLRHYSWSSPVDIYDSEGNMYFVLGDVNGKLTLFDGATGEQIDSVNLGSAIESSPIAINNRIVVGTRGSQIHSFDLV